MGAPRQRAEPGTGAAGDFHLHVETGRGRGSLSAVLAVPREPAGALAEALHRLHDPHGPLDLDVRLGALAGAAPPGTAFLVGVDDQVWVFPSSSIPARRGGGGRFEALDEPQVVPLRAGDSVELLGPDPGDWIGRIVGGGGERATRSGPAASTPRAGANRRGRVAVPGAVLGALGLALLIGLLRNEPGTEGEGRPFGAPDRRASVGEEPAAPEPAGESGTGEGLAAPGEPGIAPVAAEEDEPPSPWEFRASGAITSSPLLVGDRVLFGSRDSTLYCLDARSGARRWAVSAGAGIGSSPRAAGGLAFVGTYAGELLAVELETGDVRWRAPTGAKIVASPCVVGDRVVVGSYDRSVHAFDAQSGERQWTFATEGVIRASAEPVGEDRIAVGAGDGRVYCLGVADGRLRWRRPVRGAVFAAGAFDPALGLLVVGTQSGRALALDGASGDVRWSVPVGSEVNGQPRFAGGLVLVGTGRGILHALEAATGKTRWTARAARGFDARPLVLGDRVVAPSFDGVVHLLDLADGTTRDTRPLGSEVFSSPGAGESLLYVGTLGGSLHALAVP